jgi:hypothetical protein
MEARRFTKTLANLANPGDFTYSPRKIPVANEKGRDIARARNDVKSVPRIKGHAPNWTVTGFHSRPDRNPRPKIPRLSQEFATRVATNPEKSTTKKIAVPLRNPEKILSFMIT